MYHTVKAGDTGEKIALKYTGNKWRWRELIPLNPTKKCRVAGIRVFVGDVLALPDDWSPNPYDTLDVTDFPEDHKQYPCLHPGCFAFASYFAVGNEPKLGHVCRECFKMLPETQQACYVVTVRR